MNEQLNKTRNMRAWPLSAALAIAVFLLLSQAADAQIAPLVQLHFDGKTAASLKFRDLSISIDSAPSNESPDMKFPIFHLAFDDGRKLDVKLGDQQPREEPAADARIYSLDRSAPFPQIVLTYFWEGAHCCTVTKIVTVNGGGKMIVVDGQTLDGDGYSYEDVDGDGSVELLSFDNSFYYAFAP